MSEKYSIGGSFITRIQTRRLEKNNLGLRYKHKFILKK